MNQSEALTLALVLAITAVNKNKMQKAINLVEKISQGLSDSEIEKCKNEALTLV